MCEIRQTYPTDLNCTEWALIADLFPTYEFGRPRKWPTWLIVNAILYVARTGCQWRMMPKDLPPWSTVYGYFWRWTRNGLWECMNERLVRNVRQLEGRNPQPQRRGDRQSKASRRPRVAKRAAVDVSQANQRQKARISS